jgi:hypothetical protein
VSEKPLSPFSGLDKALLRSTRSEPPAPEQPAAPSPTTAEPAPRAKPSSARTRKPSIPRAESSHASTQASPPSNAIASNSDSTIASTLANKEKRTGASIEDIVQGIRKTVKVPGREVSFVRLTPEEKAQLSEIVHEFKRAGKKTTETEVNRIAVNYLMDDYRTHGDASVLARVIDALLA